MLHRIMNSHRPAACGPCALALHTGWMEDMIPTQALLHSSIGNFYYE
jgi:hypothetical protein